MLVLSTDEYISISLDYRALTAASTVVDYLQTNLDTATNCIACCVFIDLRKAFDTIPHMQLLDRLNQYGIRGNVNNLLRDYLSQRKQYVDINGTHSENITSSNQFSLPQGSNLGPLLFILYINDIFGLKLLQ